METGSDSERISRETIIWSDKQMTSEKSKFFTIDSQLIDKQNAIVLVWKFNAKNSSKNAYLDWFTRHFPTIPNFHYIYSNTVLHAYI